MRDRLDDIQPDSIEIDVDQTPKATRKEKKLKKSIITTEVEKHTFFDDLEKIKSNIKNIKALISIIPEIQHRVLNAITDDQNKEYSNDLEVEGSKIQKFASEITMILKNLDAETKLLKITSPDDTEISIRSSQHGVMLTNFIAVIQEYKEIQESFQLKLKERMTKQALIVNPSAGIDEIAAMIEVPVFAMKRHNTQQRHDAQTALADINRKHQEVSKIAESISELHQLFIDVSVLVAAQGVMLDHTIVHVNQAVDDTELGVKSLEKAVKIQKKTRKRMICLAVILVIIIIIAIAVPLSMKK